MNNFTFGDEGLGYYETVAGGAGAGPGWHGRSGVHTHMTNTRITDPEILERRFPLVLHRLCLRPGAAHLSLGRAAEGLGRGVPRIGSVDRWPHDPKAGVPSIRALARGGSGAHGCASLRSDAPNGVSLFSRTAH